MMIETKPITNGVLHDMVGTLSNGPEWLNALRASAADRFAEIGFPTRRDEEWRVTPIAPIVETPFQNKPGTLTAEELQPFTYAGLTGSQLVFVNGAYQAQLSRLDTLPQGVTVGTLADALASGNASLEAHLGRYAQFRSQAFVALNTAALKDGAFIHVPRNVVVDAPIHLLFVTTTDGAATVAHPRTLILADDNSQVTVLESYAGPAGQMYLTNAVTEVVMGANALVDHYKVQQESSVAYHVATLQVQLARGSNFSSHSIGLGGAIVRNDANAVLGGEHGECTLNGLYRANGRQIVDNHTSIDHAMPHCNSHEIYKGILDGHSRGVFNGKIFVREDAQKTDAKQTNKTLLLSPDAQINTKPQLEIFADDVRCTHGATIGQLSADALFYLRARGIPIDQARDLLIYAFAADIASRVKVEAVRNYLDNALLAERALDGLADE